MRWVIRAAVVSVVALMAAPAWAFGGWAASVFDDMPATFEAGATYELTYTIKQHAEYPVDVESTSILLQSSEGETLEFVASPLEAIGRYSVEVTMPADGSWQWSVTQGMFPPQQLGALDLIAPTTPAPGLIIARVLIPAAAAVALVAFARQFIAARSSRPTSSAAVTTS